MDRTENGVVEKSAGSGATRVVVDVDGRTLDLDWTGYRFLSRYIIGPIRVREVYRASPAPAGCRLANAARPVFNGLINAEVFSAIQGGAGCR